MSLYIPLSTGMKHPVRRCLFERPTAEKQEKDFQHQESKLLEDEKAKCFREKWGFDPKTGSIVNDAEYECVPVDTTHESIPSFYTKGYVARKPRPVQSLRRERSQFGLYILPTRLNFDCPPKPLKRRYPVDTEEDRDENNEAVFNDNGNKRVPSDGDVVITASLGNARSSSNVSSALFSSSSSSFDDRNSLISVPTPACFQLTNMVKSPSMPDISSRSTDLCTPQQRPRSLTQKTIKDYLPCKKQRCSTKSLPRT